MKERPMILVALALAACSAGAPTATPNLSGPAEAQVRVIPLAAPLDTPLAEISGLAWHGDDLFLLPQYPDRFGGLFAVGRQAILDYLDGRNSGPLSARLVPLDEDGVPYRVGGYEGYEAIAIVGDEMFLTIETHRELPGLGAMLGYIIAGHIAADGSAASLSAMTRMEIPAQAGLENTADEAMTVVDGRLVTFYEANGANVNPRPIAHVFEPGPTRLAASPTMTMAALEYRLTDATPAGPDGRFWVINYFFPGDRDKLKPAPDPIVARFGAGATHAACPPVERLVELRAAGGQIARTDTPPVQLTLLNCATARNWEGLAELPGRGFLLATDQHPGTILAFVASPGP
ncbi:MAG: hypothetical protein ABIQ99_02800 [Thermoflexales bacterium]